MQRQIIVGDCRVRARNRLSLLMAVQGLLDWCNACAERRAQRRTLAELSDHLLHDIGRLRSEAIDEAAKPCWRR